MAEVRCKCGQIVGVYRDTILEDWRIEPHPATGASTAYDYCDYSHEGFLDSQIIIPVHAIDVSWGDVKQGDKRHGR